MKKIKKVVTMEDIDNVLPSDDWIEAEGKESGLCDGELRMYCEGGVYIKNIIFQVLASLYDANPYDEGKERYERARVWYNTRLLRTGLDDEDEEAIIANKAMLIAAGLLIPPPQKKQ